MNDGVVIDLPGWMDGAISFIWLSMAMLHGILIARIGSTAERWLRLMGWSILAVFWAWRIVEYGNVRVSAPSVLAVLLIAVASVIAARRQLMEWAADVRCYRDNELRCHRADRIRQAIERKPQ